MNLRPAHRVAASGAPPLRIGVELHSPSRRLRAPRQLIATVLEALLSDCGKDATASSLRYNSIGRVTVCSPNIFTGPLRAQIPGTHIA